MPVVLVANPKGGSGKSTIATHIAGHFANQGHPVMLGDVDRQQSSRLWLSLRPPQVAPIRSWEAQGEGSVVRPPPGTTHAVLDTPAGLHGWRFKEVLALADKVVVPVQPSLFDIFATREFLDRLAERLSGKRVPRIGLVGMRVGLRTLAAERLREFAAQVEMPLVTELRETQNYVQVAAHGLTLFDLSPSRYERDMAQWAPLIEWLES